MGGLQRVHRTGAFDGGFSDCSFVKPPLDLGFLCGSMSFGGSGPFEGSKSDSESDILKKKLKKLNKLKNKKMK